MTGRILGKRNEDIVFMGDRLYTDIAIGVNNGVTSVLVISRETNLEGLNSLKSSCILFFHLSQNRVIFYN